MPVHWQGFRITPRDATATNPLSGGSHAHGDG
jgi:hypothetical protein